MKYKNILNQIIVGATLLGFIACSVYIFYNAFIEAKKEIVTDINNNALVYILSGLTALIGGFVAASFGVSPNQEEINSQNFKLRNLGSFAVNETKPERQELLGFIFALSYILTGITAIIIWIILNDKTIDSVSAMATTFFGMAIPIVANFLRTNQN